MSTNETLKGNPEEYVLFKDEEETTTDVKYDTKSNSRFTFGNYIVLSLFVVFAITLITCVSFLFLLIFTLLALGLFVSYKNFNFIFHKQITGYFANLINKFKNLSINKSNELYQESNEDKIFRLVNI